MQLGSNPGPLDLQATALSITPWLPGLLSFRSILYDQIIWAIESFSRFFSFLQTYNRFFCCIRRSRVASRSGRHCPTSWQGSGSLASRSGGSAGTPPLAFVNLSINWLHFFRVMPCNGSMKLKLLLRLLSRVSNFLAVFFSSFPPLLFHFVFKDFDRSDGDFDSSHWKIDFLQLRFNRAATSWLLRFQFCYFDRKTDNPLSLSEVAEFKLYESVLPARCHRFESRQQ